jgi:hypothetical protein
VAAVLIAVFTRSRLSYKPEPAAPLGDTPLSHA